ncbi:MAG: ABC transporter permease [Clostridia bacterium]|nr:ABC transporter permease [Lachnospiraceae bacterium]NCC00197.1 ABC transporter permease [Clostridia bacterium]NCD03299.1 ABC transporter permease [Clostridia bacterium]
MKKYIFKRLILLIPVLLGVTFITFGLMYLSPSDPAEMMLTAQGIPVNSEVLAEMQSRMGLDKPFILQYGTWLGKFLHGDLGNSLVNNEPVADMLMRALPTTLRLTLYSCFLTMVLAIPLGILSAVYRNRVTDYIIRVCTFVGVSVPGFFLALLLMYFFSIRLKWLPVLGGDSFAGMFLPTVTLSAAMTCKYIRQIRAAVLEELDKGYVKGARARGVREPVILFLNVLKNSMLTIVTLIAMSVGSLLGGTAVVERIYSLQGLGNVVMTAISGRDYPVVQGFVVWMALIFVFVNLAADILYRVIDPRIRLQEAERKGHRK